MYLQSQRKRVNDLTRPSRAGFQQDAYDKEVQLLRMEENLLFDLVNYLQVPMSMIPVAGSGPYFSTWVVGLIQTNTKGSSATTK